MTSPSNDNLLDEALEFLEAGLSVIAVTRAEKCPWYPWKHFQKQPATSTDLQGWFGSETNGRGLAVVTGAVSHNAECLDFDQDAVLFPPWVSLIRDKVPDLVHEFLNQTTPSGGLHVWYKCEQPVPGNMVLARRKKNGALETLIETRGEGGLVLTAPTIGYKIQQGNFCDLPTITAEQRKILIDAARSLNEVEAPEAKPLLEGAPQTREDRPGDDFNARGDIRPTLKKHGWEHVRTAEDREWWRRPGKDEGHSATLTLDGLSFFCFSSNGAPFEPNRSYDPFGVYKILEHGGNCKAAARDLAEQGYGHGGRKKPKPSQEDIAQKPSFAVDPWKCVNAEQDGDARIFIELYRNRFAFDHSSGRWFEFKGHHWGQDQRDEALAAIESVIQAYLKEADVWAKAKHAAASAEDKDRVGYAEKREKKYLGKISYLRRTHWKQSVLQLAAAGASSLGVTGEEWDIQPWLLGVKNGVVDLHDGSFRSGRADDYIRTVAPTAWKGIEESAPGWEKFLTGIFDGDQTLVQYMQRLCGYALIGETPEHIFPILYGPGGRNGKGTFLQTLAAVLGPYSGPIQSEMLLRDKFARSSSAPSADIVGLRGRRIVWASEVNQGRKLDTGRLKWLCGGDTLVGRPPYGKREIEFAPSHTLFLLTNSRPQVEAEDSAIWERISLIPFTLRFVDEPKEDRDRPRDRDLPKKLKEEKTGILAWLVRGCLEWQKDGLNPPEKVKAATIEYRDDEDDIGRFIEERCRVGETEKTKAGELYKAYKGWSEEMGSPPVWQNRFGQYMRQHFDITPKSRQGRYYLGLALEVV